MNVERFDFSCQRSVHEGFRLAKSLGHQLVEVEHVVSSFLRLHPRFLRPEVMELLTSSLEQELVDSQKILGAFQLSYGPRLQAAFLRAERERPGLVTKEAFLRSLCQESPTIQSVLQGAIKAQIQDPQPAKPINDVVQSWAPEVFSQDKQEESAAGGDSSKPEDQETSGLQLDKKTNAILRRYTVDMTALAETGEIDPIIGREQETRRVLEILGRKKKNNPILIGDPGVGKTAIAELLAMRICEGRVPETLKGVRVLSLDLGLLVGGSQYRGELEKRVKELLGIIGKISDRIILFIDEIHMLVGIGKSDGGADIANMMKPALARGELRCLGATTLAEHRKHIESDQALSRRFQPVLIKEPGEEEVLTILRGLKPRYECYHGVAISDGALIAATRLSSRYLVYRVFPDKAVDLVDEAASRMKMQVNSRPEKLEILKCELEQMQLEKESIEPSMATRSVIAQLEVKLQIAKDCYHQMDQSWRAGLALQARYGASERELEELHRLLVSSCERGDYEFAANLKTEVIPEKTTALAALKVQQEPYGEAFPFLSGIVGPEEVAEVVSSWTGIPVMRMMKSEKQKLISMEKRLLTKVFGQDGAVKRLCRALKRAKVGVNDPSRPIGVFLFLGQTGVGKTETAKALASELFDNPSKMVRIDMSEYMERHTVSRLIGAPPGYVGYGEGGELTEPIRRNPFTLVLVDEVEKGHPRILDILLQVFEDGRLTDGRGETVDFRHCLFILTSNLQVPDSSRHSQEASDLQTRNFLSSSLRPEFIGRLDEIVVFQPLIKPHLAKILALSLAGLNERLADRQMRLDLDEAAIVRLLQGNTGDARQLRRNFQVQVIDVVADWLLEHSESDSQGAWLLTLNEEKICIVKDERGHRLLSSG